MQISTTITVPRFIYELYSDVAKDLGDHTPEQAMSSALTAYAQHIFHEMKEN